MEKTKKKHAHYASTQHYCDSLNAIWLQSVNSDDEFSLRKNV